MFLGMREMDPDFPAVKPVLVDFIQPGEIIKVKCRNIFMEYILLIKTGEFLAELAISHKCQGILIYNYISEPNTVELFTRGSVSETMIFKHV